jgi:hypothetical protein
VIPEIVLHAGIHKTGSTAIQTALFHRTDIFRKHGVYYPKTGLFDGAHHHIAHAARTPDQSLPLWDELVRELAPVDTKVVLSSEEFDSLDRASIAKLQAHLSPIASRVRVLIYLRPQYSLIRSQYSQQVREGFIRSSFDAFFRDALRYARFLKQRKLVQHWVDVFGRDSVTVRSAIRSDLEGHSSLADFLEFLRLDSPVSLDELRLPSAINESLNNIQCEVVRQLSASEHFWALPFERRRKILIAFFKSCGAFQSLGKYPDPIDYRGIALCNLLFRDENESLATEFFGGKNLFQRWYDAAASDPDNEANASTVTVDWAAIYEQFTHCLIAGGGSISHRSKDA